MNERDVRQELVHNLEEWGVNDLNSKRHLDFRGHVLREGVAQFHGKSSSSTFEHLRQQTFPRDYEHAFRYFMTCELESAREVVRYIRRDRLDEYVDYCQAPYIRRLSRSDPSKVFGYKRKESFKRIPRKHLLEPFGRFQFILPDLTEAEWIWKDWFLSTKDATDGMFFEAVIACHAIQHEACFECKTRNSLRWNGGVDTSWMDLVCTFCHSTYEIKTKASMEVCETELERNNLRGGSYANYWKHRNSIQQKGQKMFLVILSREWTLGRNGKRHRPISCAEIDYVLPQLTPSCFRPKQPPPGLTHKQRERYKVLSLRARVKVKQDTKEKWFDLEKWEPPIEYGLIMEEVFAAKYSRAEFDQIEIKFCGADNEDNGDGGETKSQPKQKQNESIAQLKSALEGMTNDDDVVDDWEELCSESEEEDDEDGNDDTGGNFTAEFPGTEGVVG